MQIIYAINAMVLREARAAKILDDAAISAISVIDESGERRRAHGQSRLCPDRTA